jgi:hypothetical protein
METDSSRQLVSPMLAVLLDILMLRSSLISAHTGLHPVATGAQSVGDVRERSKLSSPARAYAETPPKAKGMVPSMTSQAGCRQHRHFQELTSFYDLSWMTHRCWRHLRQPTLVFYNHAIGETLRRPVSDP